MKLVAGQDFHARATSGHLESTLGPGWSLGGSPEAGDATARHRAATDAGSHAGGLVLRRPEGVGSFKSLDAGGRKGVGKARAQHEALTTSRF